MIRDKHFVWNDEVALHVATAQPAASVRTERSLVVSKLLHGSAFHRFVHKLVFSTILPVHRWVANLVARY